MIGELLGLLLWTVPVALTVWLMDRRQQRREAAAAADRRWVSNVSRTQARQR